MPKYAREAAGGRFYVYKLGGNGGVSYGES